MQERQQILNDRAQRMANFCIGTGLSPDIYRQLTQREIKAFIKEANKRSGQKEF